MLSVKILGRFNPWDGISLFLRLQTFEKRLYVDGDCHGSVWMFSRPSLKIRYISLDLI